MAWEDDERRFRPVDKTVADVGMSGKPAPPSGTDPESLELEATSRREPTEPKAPVPPAPVGPPSEFDATRLASPKRPRFEVAARFRGAVGPCEAVALVPAGGAQPGTLLLVAREEFRLGRSTQEVDYVAWVLPRSARNDVLTRRISRVHARVVLDAGRLWLSDCGTTNGTAIGGVVVTERSQVPTGGTSEVVLGGEYRLVVDPSPVPFPGLEVEGLTGVARDVPCGAVRFHAVEGPGPERQPVWLLAQAAFGKGRGCAIRLQDRDLADVQGIFCSLQGAIWVGALSAEGEVFVDDTMLIPGELAPLLPGHALKIGKRSYRIEAP